MTSRRFKIALAITAALSAVSLTIAGWAFYVHFEQANAYRRADQRIWTAVICQLERRVAATKSVTAQQIQASLRFYDRLLTQDVQTTGCGLTERKP